MRSSFQPGFSILAAALLLAPSTFAFDTPLSDQAVREAYFLGQRHDGTFALLLSDKYTKHFPIPETGPHISSIVFLTPFMQSVQYSDRFIGNYSAQQAALDHRDREETVQILVHILFTASYGPLIAPQPNASSPNNVPTPRPYDFWKDFDVQVLDGDRTLSPTSFDGEAVSHCSRSSCTMYGATITLEFPAESFPSDAVSIQVTPPEGALVSTDFDLTRLR
jgi:hypothetical protein